MIWILQVNNVIVLVLFVIVNGECVGSPKIDPEVALFLLICIWPQYRSTVGSCYGTFGPLSSKIRLERVLLPFPNHLVLLKLPLLVGPSLQLAVILLLERLNAEPVLEPLFPLPLAPNDLFLIRDAHGLHLQTPLLLCLLLDRPNLGLLPLQFQLRPHVQRDTV